MLWKDGRRRPICIRRAGAPIPPGARLPDERIHETWAAPADALAGAGIELGRNYPAPVVDPAAARARALEALAEMRCAAAKERPRK